MYYHTNMYLCQKFFNMIFSTLNKPMYYPYIKVDENCQFIFYLNLSIIKYKTVLDSMLNSGKVFSVILDMLFMTNNDFSAQKFSILAAYIYINFKYNKYNNEHVDSMVIEFCDKLCEREPTVF